MTQTNNFIKYFSGLNLDIEPKEIISPRGKANTRVMLNNKQVVPNPCNKPAIISAKFSISEP